MNTINLKKYNLAIPITAVLGVCLILSAWWLIGYLQMENWIVGSIDLAVLQVIALSLGTWMLLLSITLAIISKLSSMLLTQLKQNFEPSKKLTSWQQHVLYLALFALLVLSGTGCLIAIC